MQLLDLPEEILALILEYAILPLDSRSFIPRSPSLLTCHTIHRIGLPILYRTLLLRSSYRADLIQRTLFEQPTLVRHVRNIYSTAKTTWLLLVLRAIGLAKGSLQTLEFVLNNYWVNIPHGERDAEESLAAVPVRRLAVRQGNSPLLLRERELAFVNALARAIERWPNLENVVIEPRKLLSCVTPGQPAPLALALSRSPSLRSVRTALPPEWDPSLLVTSENPSLTRIALTSPRLSSSPDGIMVSNVDLSAASLFAQKDAQPWLVEAQKHDRLMELVCATPTPDDNPFE